MKAESLKMVEEFKRTPSFQKKSQISVGEGRFEKVLPKICKQRKRVFRVNSTFLFRGVDRAAIGDFKLSHLKKIALHELKLPPEKWNNCSRRKTYFATLMKVVGVVESSLEGRKTTTCIKNEWR